MYVCMHVCMLIIYACACLYIHDSHDERRSCRLHLYVDTITRLQYDSLSHDGSCPKTCHLKVCTHSALELSEISTRSSLPRFLRAESQGMSLVSPFCGRHICRIHRCGPRRTLQRQQPVSCLQTAQRDRQADIGGRFGPTEALHECPGSISEARCMLLARAGRECSHRRLAIYVLC